MLQTKPAVKPVLPLDTIIQGNCIEIMRTLPDACVDLIFADPPYNLQLHQELRRPDHTIVDAVHDEWDKFQDFVAYDAFTKAWLQEAQRILKDTGTIWVIGSYHNIFRVGTALMDLGFWILNDVIWYKTNPMPNFRGTRFTNATETLIWAKKSENKSSYTFDYTAMKHFNDEKQMQNVWHIPLCTGNERIRENGQKAHSTQKPEALLQRIIIASTHVGDTILDPFFGSGTTGAVAKKLKRHFIGIEREASYVRIAKERIEHIVEPLFAESVLLTHSKRAERKVLFGELIEAGYIKAGEILYSKNREYSCIVKTDSHVIWNEHIGSIHSIGALVQHVTTCNGWHYWYQEQADGSLQVLDMLREQYREMFLEADVPLVDVQKNTIE